MGIFHSHQRERQITKLENLPHKSHQQILVEEALSNTAVEGDIWIPVRTLNRGWKTGRCHVTRCYSTLLFCLWISAGSPNDVIMSER
ncbi:unnamed protein product [Larinioides sclopetarius]|uniref:Uncharacterized protein n=1 Tax=Larinioides sclopetarius TaxID=280406 RepID=A0AAV2BD55_9ARAC